LGNPQFFRLWEDVILEQVKEKLLSVNKNIEIIDDKYINSMTSLKCNCLICGTKFNTYWSSINSGSGCPNCSATKGERKVQIFLKDNDISYEQQKKFNDLFGISGKRKLSYDFFLPDFNTLIEYDGVFHYAPMSNRKNMEEAIKIFKRQQIHDQMKNKYASKNDIILIRIPYTEYENIEEILAEKLKI